MGNYGFNFHLLKINNIILIRINVVEIVEYISLFLYLIHNMSILLFNKPKQNNYLFVSLLLQNIFH